MEIVNIDSAHEINNQALAEPVEPIILFRPDAGCLPDTRSGMTENQQLAKTCRLDWQCQAGGRQHALQNQTRSPEFCISQAGQRQPIDSYSAGTKYSSRNCQR